MKTVLISKFSPQALAFLKSCYCNKIDTLFLWIADKKEPVPKSKFIENIYKIPQDLVFSDKGIELIKESLNEQRKYFLISTSEKISGWLYKSETLGDGFFEVLFSENMDNILSKTKQLETARKSGLNLLPTFYITKDKKSYSTIPESNYPLCLRPSELDSVKPGFKVLIIKNQDEMENYIKGLEKLNSHLLAQPFMDVPNLVVHGSMDKLGNVFGLEGFIVKNKFEGVSLTIQKYKIDKSLKEKCKKFVQSMDVYGPFHFEFLYDEVKNKNWFLEINNRMGGTTAKVFSLGYDEPAYILKSMGVNISADLKISSEVSSNKAGLIKYLLNIISNRLSPLDYSDKSLKIEKIVFALKGLFFFKDDILSLKDLKSISSFYKALIYEKLKG
ncbi:MAG: hypothetical protein RBR53_03390 [Desulforegulaceae bacterium]|nr:hypothetical protein [Desulforegulaceae bacterium]